MHFQISICICESQNICRNVDIYLSDFVKTWPLGFRLASGAALLQASAVSKQVGAWHLGRYSWIA